MIKSIRLENFKCYKSRELIFSNLTVFCGSNSVGKSTAIQALAIPFQSRFEEYCHINGSLVNLGECKDIYSTYADPDAEEEVVGIELNLKINNEDCFIAYGFKTQEEQVSNFNKLKLNIHNISRQTLCKSYFEDHGFQFLEAERYGPRNYFNLNQNNDIRNWLGSRGEHTLEVINKLLKVRGTDLNDKDTDVTDLDCRVHANTQNYSIHKNIELWMSEISPGFSLTTEIVENAGISHTTFQANGSDKTKPINMGFGLSYALSIVTSLLITKPNGLVIIENPEAHLHPRGQSYLGRLIALSALAGVQVVVETHSDHLLNGIRVIARLKDEYKKGMFKVYYVSAGEEQSNVDEITIGSKGELSSWPEGFFDQQAYDIRTLMKGVDQQEAEK